VPEGDVDIPVFGSDVPCPIVAPSDIGIPAASIDVRIVDLKSRCSMSEIKPRLRELDIAGGESRPLLSTSQRPTKKRRPQAPS